MPLHFALPAVPYLKLAAVEDPASGAVTLFALSRHLAEAMPLDVSLAGCAALRVGTALRLRHRDLTATNTCARPDEVAPTPLVDVGVGSGRVEAALAPASWNVIRLERAT